MRHFIVAFTIALVLAGCLNEQSGGSGGSGGSDAADTVQCTGQNPVFPTFDKTCAVANDCFVGLHQISCCGTYVAIGVHTSERTRFQDDEARCEAMYPGCGCAAQPTRAEDGRTATNPAQIVVRCDANRCLTAVP